MVIGVDSIAVVGILAGLWWRRRRHSRRAGSGLPSELRTARMIFAERLFRSTGPVLSITARIDRAYRNAAGELVLLELKTRRVSRVYPSDIIELSAQRVAVMAQTRQPVAGHLLKKRVQGHHEEPPAESNGGHEHHGGGHVAHHRQGQNGRADEQAADQGAI